MCDEKKYTEKAVVLRERDAVVRVLGYLGIRGWFDAGQVWGWPGIDNIAKELYPLPKVERPRVVKDPHDPRVEWAVVDGRIHTHGFHGNITPERVELWADLLAHPTETVAE